MNTAYTILATVTLEHEYYADGRCNDFDIVPSAATAAALKGAGILTKTIGNALILLVRMEEQQPGQAADAVPTFMTLPANLKLVFYLRLNNPLFLNYTNASYHTGQVFYFTNLLRPATGSTLYLNQPLPAFDISHTYAIGDLAQDAGHVFEAIKVKPAAPGGHAISDAAFWYKRAADQYAHNGDLLTLTDGLLQVATLPAKNFDVSVFGLNTATLLYDVPVGDAMRQEFPVDQKAITVNLAGIAPGKYKVIVNGREQLVYADAAASYAHVFGIIELYNLFNAENTFGLLLNGAGHPKGLDHVIRFANRLAIWKYITRTENAFGINVGSDAGLFTGHAPQFRSVSPMPLREEPLKTLSLMKDRDTVLAGRLANPPPDRISTYRDADENDYYCAEIYLNY